MFICNILLMTGYGHWSFDESMFFTACVNGGFQSWTSYNDCENDFSLPSLIPQTAKFLRECGICVTSGSAGTVGHTGVSISTPNRQKHANSRRGGIGGAPQSQSVAFAGQMSPMAIHHGTFSH